MLVSVLVDRYQRIFTRKLYIEPDKIDFDDFSNEDDVNDRKRRESNQNSRVDSAATEHELEKMIQKDICSPIMNPLFYLNTTTSNQENPIINHIHYMKDDRSEISEDNQHWLNHNSVHQNTSEHEETLNTANEMNL